MKHLPNDLLDRYSVDGLTEPEIARTEEHLLVCQLCRDRLDEFETFRVAIRTAASNDLPLSLGILSQVIRTYETGIYAIGK
jgi:hypothetical protein